MIINRLREKINSSFTMLPNEVFEGNLSHKAIGIFAYLLSRQEGWRFNIQEIKKHFKVGVDTIRNTLKELEENKMLLRIQHKDNKGRFGKIDYILYPNEDDFKRAKANNEKSNIGKSDMEKSDMEKTNIGKSNTNNIEYNNTEYNNIKRKKREKKEITHPDDKLFDSNTYRLLQDLKVDKEFAYKLIAFRKSIKKPFNTSKALNGLLNEYLKASFKLGVSAEVIFEVQEKKEWIGIKADWVKRELSDEVSGDMPMFSDAVNANVVAEFLADDSI